MDRMAVSLTDFYAGKFKDSHGRSLSGILAKDDDWLERSHTHIQWLFPLTEPSRAVPSSPVLSGSDIASFRGSEGLRANLRASFDRMLEFYGLLKCESIETGCPLIAKHPVLWVDRKFSWVQPGDHNHLRLTRIMKSMRLLGEPELADALKEVLMVIADENPISISGITKGFWKEA
jgi:hypothetical protein